MQASYGTGTVKFVEAHGLTISSAFPDGVYFNVIQVNENSTACVGIDISEAGVSQGPIIPEPTSIILGIGMLAFFIRRK